MWQPVLMINGYLISVLGLAMLIPAVVDMLETGQNWSSFITSAIISLFIGLSLFLGNRTKIEKITLQQGYLLTVVSWVSLTLLATLPFIFFGITPNFADALFEAMRLLPIWKFFPLLFCYGVPFLTGSAESESSFLPLRCCHFWESAACRYFSAKIRI